MVLENRFNNPCPKLYIKNLTYSPQAVNRFIEEIIANFSEKFL